MRINEIEIVPTPNFPRRIIQGFLEKATPVGLIDSDQFRIYQLEHPIDDGVENLIILTDLNGDVAGYAGFISRLNGKIWQAKNAAIFDPHKGSQLMGKLYKFVKTELKKSIQSDNKQSFEGAKLWTKTLPALGLKPMILDTTTEKILDPTKQPVDVYSIDDPDRYIWILERNDSYPSQNLLTENSLLLPYTGLWYIR